ncbi:hypothetical protein YW7DRAFT_04549 [Streptomyces sp. AmelKG-E11A]|nr:hypothetical protein YW7DRAFT_04549 [Streptomyces sp. AmelKG-E11A]
MAGEAPASGSWPPRAGGRRRADGRPRSARPGGTSACSPRDDAGQGADPRHRHTPCAAAFHTHERSTEEPATPRPDCRCPSHVHDLRQPEVRAKTTLPAHSPGRRRGWAGISARRLRRHQCGHRTSVRARRSEDGESRPAPTRRTGQVRPEGARGTARNHRATAQEQARPAGQTSEAQAKATRHEEGTRPREFRGGSHTSRWHRHAAPRGDRNTGRPKPRTRPTAEGQSGRATARTRARPVSRSGRRCSPPWPVRTGSRRSAPSRRSPRAARAAPPPRG